MKKTMLIAFLLTTLVSAASAQQQGGFGPPQDAGDRGVPRDRLAEQLGLNEGQALQVQAIFEEARALHQEEQTKNHEAFCAIRMDTHERLMAVLTDEQQATFMEMKARRDEHRALHMEERGEFGQGGGRQGRGPGGNGNGAGDRPGPGDCDF